MTSYYMKSSFRTDYISTSIYLNVFDLCREIGRESNFCLGTTMESPGEDGEKSERHDGGTYS